MKNRGSGRLLAADRSVASIVAELQREFETEYLASVGSRPERDPMLAVLFHALAVQVGRIYDDAEREFPLRVIDDLVASLGLPSAVASPAQVTVEFMEVARRQKMGSNAAIVGATRTGEEIRFELDNAFDVVPAVVRFAGVAEAGRLYTLSGAALGDDGRVPLAPNVVSLERSEGLAPILFLAIDLPDGEHPSQMGVHFDAKVGAPISEALARSPWTLLQGEGIAREGGILLPRASRGGVRALAWGAFGSPPDGSSIGERRVDLAEGPYGLQSFLLPTFSEAHRWRSLPPPLIRRAITRPLPEELRGAYDHPMYWFAVTLPAGSTKVAQQLRGVTLNSMTASNVEVLSQRWSFERDGRAAVTLPEGAKGRHLLGIARVTGEHGGPPYVSESDVTAPAGAGRYRADRTGVMIETQRLDPDREDRYVMARLIYTDGERGNGVEVGRLGTFAADEGNELLSARFLNPSRGGSNPPEYPLGRLRLAEALRSRERAVTASDFELLVKAFDSRVAAVRVSVEGSVSEGRLQPVHRVTVGVTRGAFSDPDSEIPRLRAVLERRLQERALLGQVVRVAIESAP
ncbi:MAG: hypothetical protein IPK33_03130 [Gemmatimonadetes bacterium]|nr:hypothetical protein [Gemmatimonadota bacterium]